VENTDKLDIPSNLLQIVLEDDDFLKDTKFKILFTEPKVAINLVQTLIPFLETNKERNLDDVINNSITTYKFYDIELKNVPLCDRVSAVMEKSNEIITNTGKVFRHDVLFDYKVGEGEKDIYTINFEMQNAKEDYDMLERALCYAISISANMLHTGDNYNKLHKVYSIWFLNFNYFDDDIAVHSIAPRVYYNRNSDMLTNVTAEQSEASYHQNADLIEVVFIELKKREQIRNAENLKKLLDVICNNEKETETLKTLLNLTDEEVRTMLKQVNFREEILEEGKEKGKEEGKQEERKIMIKVMLSNGMTVDQIAKAISISEDVVKSYI
jgi:predicted transposase/invertase (TIGR01784 family)